jgi:metal-responsive CopG/Arc/MetJ family transcriptional regulator
MPDTVRVTLVFPKKLWEEVKRLIPAGERSKVIAEATEWEIRRRKRMEGIKRIRNLQESFRRKYGEIPSCVEEIRQMREERDAETTGLR